MEWRAKVTMMDRKDAVGVVKAVEAQKEEYRTAMEQLVRESHLLDYPQFPNGYPPRILPGLILACTRMFKLIRFIGDFPMILMPF